ncbi:MAG: L-seryl-tRNA(Sec) selenium transferase [Proteobacteria bacterium]|nr:L-seryl-tRNA(Sec) selenium transferase [Pseudomonadota bacterium]
MPKLRDLPAIDTLLQADELQKSIAAHGLQTVKATLRDLQTEMRNTKAVPEWADQPNGYAEAVVSALGQSDYTPVFNLSGTIIHTNLGRAVLSTELWSDIEPLVTRPMNLEYDLKAGKRGQRDAVVEARLCRIIGCEAATVVNNCAAALMLVLNTFALNKKVPVSRGELVEIGGSFRLPELMSRAGCELIEVGTTNRTRLSDFSGVADQAAMLLKVHPSNYHIEGFTESVDAKELATLAREHELPSCVDLGSGTLVDLTQFGLPAEPTPQQVLADGVDLITFSGDKLLGGVQAGIIVGKREMIERIRKNPMKRALRADKITLSVLEATLKLYEDPTTLDQKIPILRLMSRPVIELEQAAIKLKSAFSSDFFCTVETTEAQIGSGALPDRTLPSLALKVSHKSVSAAEISNQLRALPIPVIGRIKDDCVWLDLRCAEPLDELMQQISQLSPLAV